MPKIIYADDEIKYRELVEMFLKSKGYNILLAKNGIEAFDLLLNNPDTDLVILDVMMPEMDGYETCREINKEFSVPILMLTALGSLEEEIQGIKTGADDYISKPFRMDLLMARVEALIRRSSKIKKKMQNDSGIYLDSDQFILIIDDKKIALAPMEFKLFEYLFINKNIILSRFKILDNVWGYDYNGNCRTVDTHIKELRAKMGEHGKRIVTVRSKGYYYKGDKK